MVGISNLSAYILGVIAIIVLPGPNSLFCLCVSAKDGIKAGYWVLLGILLGDSLLMLATVFGAGAMLKLYPSLFIVIKLIGGLYLAYLGYKLIYASLNTWQYRHQSTPPSYAINSTHPFWQSLMLSLTNPKAILFFLSFFVQFVRPDYPHPLLSFLVLAMILQLVSFLYLNALIWFGKRLADHLARHRSFASVGTGLIGLLFVGFAINLWLSQL